MGVHGLWKLIDSSGKAIPLEALENRVLAVDVSIWLYQLVKGFQESGGHSVANAYLLGLFHRICKLLFYRIKPIFVFDGGVPALKRRTIADRQNSRSKANRLGEKLRQTLLENLAKQEALGQVLGENVVIPKLFQPKQDSLFQLPPLPVIEEVIHDSSSDSEAESEIYRYKDIHSIDIMSEEFLSLPPDMRHDILTELKETRKQNSWGKLHLIPKESNEFSNYQMKRLLKRRAVQVGIEKAEGEMGTRGFTLSDLQTILSEQGVDLAQRIASDNSTRLLYNNKIKEIVKDESHDLNEPCCKKKKLSHSSTEKVKNLLVNDNDNSVSSEIEDDPRTLSSPEKEGLSQDEILQLIKQENEHIPIAKEPVSRASDPSKLKNIETEKRKELTVNGEAVENETGNNVVELEHGSLPQERTPCQQSSPHPVPQPQLSTTPQTLDVGKQECLTDVKENEFVKASQICRATPQIEQHGTNETIKGTEILKKRNGPVTNGCENYLAIDPLSSNDAHQIDLAYTSGKRQEISFSLSKSESGELLFSESLYKSANSPDERSSEIKSIKLGTPESKKRLEVLNLLNKMKKEMLSPVKAPIFSTINIKSKRFSQGNEFEKKLSSVSEVSTGNGKSSSEASDDDFIEVSNEEEEVVDSQMQERLSVPLEVAKDDNNLSIEASDENFIAITNEEKGVGIQIKEKLNTSLVVLGNEMQEKLDTFTKVITGTGNLSSEESDNDFIEVNHEEAEEVNEGDLDELKKTYSEKNLNITNIVAESNQPTSSLEIVVNSIDTLEDDLFADVFTNPASLEPKVEHPRLQYTTNDIPSSNDVKCTRIESVNEQMDTPLVMSENVEPTILTDKIEDIIVPIDTPRAPSPVPQLSVEEIMKMKRDLEKESSHLMVETSREERIASTITEQIRLDAQELLRLFGVPYIIAPMEAEAQCAHLDITGQTQGTITDDSDIWLFGGKNVYKNFFDQKKFVLQFKSTDIKRVLHIERDEMIMIALLTGSDYTLGLTGVGAVTALEVVAHYPKTEIESSPCDRLRHFVKEFKENKLTGHMTKKLKKASVSEGFPSSEVMSAYLDPEVDQSSEKFSWSKPNLTELRRYTREKFGWDSTKTDKILEPIFDNLNKTQTQGTLHSFFEWKFDAVANQRSKRVENAINLMKTPSLLTDPGPSKPRPVIKGNPISALEQRIEIPVKSKTPAQVARERAAKKFKELKKQGKLGPKAKKK